MRDHDHPSSDLPNWDNPDFCPVCGAGLPDGGPGFVDHIEADENATCRERFEVWRGNIGDDMGGDWGG